MRQEAISQYARVSLYEKLSQKGDREPTKQYAN